MSSSIPDMQIEEGREQFRFFFEALESLFNFWWDIIVVEFPNILFNLIGIFNKCKICFILWVFVIFPAFGMLEKVAHVWFKASQDLFERVNYYYSVVICHGELWLSAISATDDEFLPWVRVLLFQAFSVKFMTTIVSGDIIQKILQANGTFLNFWRILRVKWT